jgi:hypothetical protein
MRSVRRSVGLALAIAVVAVCALVAVSAAQERPRSSPRGGLNGGLIGKRFSAHGTQFVRVSRSTDGRRVLFVGDLLADCANVNFTLPGFDLRQKVPVGKGGRFSGGRAFHDSGPYGTEDGTFEFRGRDRGGRSISGNARLRMTVQTSQPGTVHCDTGKFHWKVIALKKHSGSGRLRGGAAYFGQTFQRPGGFPFLLRAAKSKRRIALTAFESRTDCPKGSDSAADVEIEGLSISKKGRIKGRTSLDQELQTGTKEHRTYSVRGAFGHRKVAGTLRVRVIVKRQGKVVDRCDSGRVRWHAQRAL